MAFLHLPVHYFLDPLFDPVTGLLDEEESRHAIKSLRMQVGDSLVVGNGHGIKYTCEVEYMGKKQLKLAVKDTLATEKRIDTITIALAPTKNTSRYEWFLEKATELGIDQIIPLETKRTERARINAQRSERIIHAATKQSQRSHMPELAPLISFEDACRIKSNTKLIAHCDPGFVRTHIRNIMTKGTKPPTLILIGPEGDFSPEEIRLAAHLGFQGIDLGENRLRTETAGVFVAGLAAAFRG